MTGDPNPATARRVPPTRWVRFRRVWRRAWGRRYYRDAAGYWQQRHLRHGSTLGGVGTLGLGAGENQLDYETKWDHLEAALTRVGAHPCDVLDAGCGNGWFTVRLRDAGYRPEAVDFSPAAVELTREAVGPGVKVGVAPLDRYEAGRRFPLVVCIDVLFHVTDDGAWLAAVANVADHVDDGGRLLIQDHLIEVATGPVDPSTSHTRWRTLDTYLHALDGWELAVHDHYVLPGEGRTKDLMIFERASR